MNNFNQHQCVNKLARHIILPPRAGVSKIVSVFYVSMDLKATTANIYENNSDFCDDKFMSVEKVLKGSTKAKLQGK